MYRVVLWVDEVGGIVVEFTPRVIARNEAISILYGTKRRNNFGIADAKSSLSFSEEESDQRKLPAAPASMNVSANCSVVLPEPDDAGFCV